MWSLVKLHAKQMLSPLLDIVGSEEAAETTTMFVEEIAALESRRVVES